MATPKVLLRSVLGRSKGRLLRTRPGRVLWQVAADGRTVGRLFRDALLLNSDAWGKPETFRPKIIQFPIASFCNAKCVMCNIWQLKRSPLELDVHGYRQVFSDPVFSEVRAIGVHGGEPTLRADLPEVMAMLVEVLPRLQNITVITNAVRPKQALERLNAVDAVCKAAGARLTVCLSIDGVGEVHDRHRGKKGNFAAVEEVRKGLVAAGIAHNAACTLTAQNAFDADDTLAYFETNLPAWQFRAAEFIERLGMDEGNAYRDKLPRAERFHLGLFFQKLSHHPKVYPVRQRFYDNLSRNLLLDEPRDFPCSWGRGEGLTVGFDGELSFCSVASPALGNAVSTTVSTVLAGRQHVLKAIRDNHCAHCLHDLSGPEDLRTGLLRIGTRYRDAGERLLRRVEEGQGVPDSTPAQGRAADPKAWQRAMVIGWWGTETHGDKAILGEAYTQLRRLNPQMEIVLSSLGDGVCQQTLREMGFENMRIVPLRACARRSQLRDVDAVVIGGGPLMDCPVDLLRDVFRSAARLGKARIIFGCGYGPLRDPGNRQAVAEICGLATGGFWRDAESLAQAQPLAHPSVSFHLGCDPAVAFVRRWHEGWKKAQAEPGEPEVFNIAAMLRHNTTEYVAEGRDACVEENRRLAAVFAKSLCGEVDGQQLKTSLVAMHQLPVGGDDRLLYREIVALASAPDGEAPTFDKAYRTFYECLESIAAADGAIAMRYHGHLFALAMGLPLISIDYSGPKGKVGNLMRRLGLSDLAMASADVDGAALQKNIARLVREPETLRKAVVAGRDEMLRALAASYAQVLGLDSLGDKAQAGAAALETAG